MKHLLLFENFDYGFEELILPKGTLIYHGTGEKFDYNDIRPGAYDKVFWTCLNKEVAKCYIPESGTSVYTSIDNLANIRNYENSKKILNALGIEYEDYKMDGDSISYKEPDIFKQNSQKMFDLMSEMIRKDKELKTILKKSNDPSISDEEVDELFEKMRQLEKEIAQLNKSYDSIAKYKEKYIQEKLGELGYEENSYGKYQLKLDSSGDLMRSDWKLTGKLITMKTKKDLRIYDMTLGESLEPDLTETQYHSLSKFRQAESSSYDGVKINDFCQHKRLGNVEHTSLGFFKDTIPFLEIVSITDATHPDTL